MTLQLRQSEEEVESFLFSKLEQNQQHQELPWGKKDYDENLIGHITSLLKPLGAIGLEARTYMPWHLQ